MLLVVNAGSSSIKLAVFAQDLTEVLTGSVSEIGGAGRLRMGHAEAAVQAKTHAEALTLAFAAMEQQGIPLSQIKAAAHRVVHGGEALVQARRIDEAVLAGIEACVPLAPLHNPANLTAIKALARLAPDLAQYASFDTAFHATNPEVAVTYALPDEHRAKGYRRYGFHGLSYASMVRKLQEMRGGNLPRRLLALHLGNGASLCAIREGQSVATTMGYSPLDGLTMGTRCGAVDGTVVLALARDHGVDGASRILNRESGLLGLGGASDMRSLHAARTPEARLAIDHFCYWATRHAGSMIAAMGGLDAIAFTGGIGENDHIVRARILDGLAWTGAAYDAPANRQGAAVLHETHSNVAIWTVRAEEERQIAFEAISLGAGGQP